MILTIIAFVVILGLLVLVHEFGHFVTAKKAGLSVEEFGFGFPPKIFGFKIGETVYSINWIPFGGFVKILGEGGEQESDSKSFASRSVGVKIIIIGAGVVMNFLTAIILLIIVNMAGSTTVIDESNPIPPQAVVSESSVTITAVEENSPGQEAGLHPGDKVVSINDQPIDSEDRLIDQIKQNLGQNVTMQYARGDKSQSISLIPRENPPQGQGPIGIGLVKTATVSYPWYLAIWQGTKQAGILTWTILVMFWEIIKELFATGKLDANVAGPIGIAVITGQVLELGFVPLLQFAAVLAINLSIINILPFPALDGGRLLFLIIEKIRGKKVSKKIENMSHSIGFVLLIVLVVLITFRDFFRFGIIDKIRNFF